MKSLSIHKVEDEGAGVAGRPMPLADIQVRMIGDGARAFAEMALPGVVSDCIHPYL